MWHTYVQLSSFPQELHSCQGGDRFRFNSETRNLLKMKQMR